jgi:hypothetical protein
MAPGVGAETELARDATFASDRPRQRARLAISGVYLDPIRFSLAGPTAFRRLRTCGARPVFHPSPSSACTTRNSVPESTSDCMRLPSTSSEVRPFRPSGRHRTIRRRAISSRPGLPDPTAISRAAIVTRLLRPGADPDDRPDPGADGSRVRRCAGEGGYKGGIWTTRSSIPPKAGSSTSCFHIAGSSPRPMRSSTARWQIGRTRKKSTSERVHGSLM